VLEKGQLGLEFLNSLGGIKYMSNGFELSTCELNFAIIDSTQHHCSKSILIRLSIFFANLVLKNPLLLK
jgi:hypothetical protein